MYNIPTYQVAAPMSQPPSEQPAVLIVDDIIQPVKSVADRPATPPVMAPCIQRFLDDGFFYPPNTKTQEGLTQSRSIADNWANYTSLPVKLIHAWRSLGIEKDETNPRELRTFKREGIIRKQCYSIWRSSGRNHRQLDEIMHDLMKRHNIMKYRPTRQELFNQQKQVGTAKLQFTKLAFV